MKTKSFYFPAEPISHDDASITGSQPYWRRPCTFRACTAAVWCSSIQGRSSCSLMLDLGSLLPSLHQSGSCQRLSRLCTLLSSVPSPPGTNAMLAPIRQLLEARASVHAAFLCSLSSWYKCIMAWTLLFHRSFAGFVYWADISWSLAHLHCHTMRFVVL